MRIRAGYDIAYQCPQPTRTLLAFSVHPSRMPDVIGPHEIRFDPPVGAAAHRDGSGNICHRVIAPAGQLRISTHIRVSDSGTPDVIVPDAPRHRVQDLPGDTLVYLLGSRYGTGYPGDIGVPPMDAPMDFSAWFEAYLGHWHTFDARHNQPRIGRILMARGRDATDVALSTIFGPSVLAGFNVVTEEVT